MPIAMKAAGPKDPRCKDHRGTPMAPCGVELKLVTRTAVQEAAETAAAAARARLLERGVTWTRPTKAELGNGCPHCAAASAAASMAEVSSEPYAEPAKSVASLRPRTETVLKETRTAPRRRPRVTSVPIRHTF